MKYLLSILLLLCTATGWSQAYIDAGGSIRPVGQFPIAHSQELQGAIIAVQTIADRNAIADIFRNYGMLVWVKDSSAHYTLAGGLTNDSWVKLNLTGTVNGVGFEVDPLSVHISDTIPMLAPYLRWVDTTGKWQTKLTQEQINFWNHGGDIINNYSSTAQTLNFIDSLINLRKYTFNADQFTVTNNYVSIKPFAFEDSTWRNSPLFGTTQARIDKWDSVSNNIIENYYNKDEVNQLISDSLKKYITYFDSAYYAGDGNDPNNPLRNKLKTINKDSIHGIGNLTIIGGIDTTRTGGTGGTGGTGSGTVTSVSIINTYGISGTVANPTTVPSITMVIDTSKIATSNSVTNLRQNFLDSVTNIKNSISNLQTQITNNYYGGDSTTGGNTGDTTINDGSTITIGNNVKWYIVNPGTVKNALTLKLPPAPKQGQEIKISFGGVITTGVIIRALSLVPNTGQGILQGTTPLVPESGETISYKYNQPNAKWYRL